MCGETRPLLILHKKDFNSTRRQLFIVGFMTYIEIRSVTTIAQIAQNWGLESGTKVEESYTVQWSETKKPGIG